jgi:hypothetical protein
MWNEATACRLAWPTALLGVLYRIAFAAHREHKGGATDQVPNA